jgi:electron transfer flavoprotein beta subunit
LIEGNGIMRIAVCMKQVPAVNEGKMDEKMGTLIRKDLPPIVNPYDMHALETALRLKDSRGAVIAVFTMGPRNAESLLKEAFAMGADEGYLISDRSFAGADAIATAYTLAQAIESKGPFDMVICGRQTTDGDTAQVSGATARFMGIPHVNWVIDLAEVSNTSVTVLSRMEQNVITAKMSFPCLISVERSICIPRIPTLASKIKSKKKSVELITLNDLGDSNPEYYGMKGSATKVVKIFSPESAKQFEVAMLSGKEAAKYIMDILGNLSGNRNS